MPKVHYVKAARKSNKSLGIKKGQPYYWWKFPYGGKHVSFTPPRKSQLTQSEFFRTLYSVQETIEDVLEAAMSEAETATRADPKESDPSPFTGMADELESAASEIETLGGDCSEKFNNMPEGLQQGETGQLLEQRAEGCEQLRCELEDVAGQVRDMTPEEADDARSAVEGINWDIGG